jgi:hypothetical protein
VQDSFTDKLFRLETLAKEQAHHVSTFLTCCRSDLTFLDHFLRGAEPRLLIKFHSTDSDTICYGEKLTQ